MYTTRISLRRAAKNHDLAGQHRKTNKQNNNNNNNQVLRPKRERAGSARDYFILFYCVFFHLSQAKPPPL
jgi:hypothetical protein